jgi:hypothetical protein
MAAAACTTPVEGAARVVVVVVVVTVVPVPTAAAAHVPIGHRGGAMARAHARAV